MSSKKTSKKTSFLEEISFPNEYQRILNDIQNNAVRYPEVLDSSLRYAADNHIIILAKQEESCRDAQRI